MADLVMTATVDVATVTVDNPPVNALSDVVLDELLGAAGALIADREARAVVVPGGRGRFLTGADLVEMDRVLGDAAEVDVEVEVEVERHVARTGAVFGAWDRLDRPVIAPVAARLSTTMKSHRSANASPPPMACHVRLALPEVALRLIPGTACTQRLPRRVSAGPAARILLTGGAVAGATAYRLGLVDNVAADGQALATASELGAQLGRLPSRAVRAAKAALRASASSLHTGLERQRRLFEEVAMSDDARGGGAAFVTKRKPTFSHT
jgi:enoyl-CoA hydratase/carnithine racemase